MEKIDIKRNSSFELVKIIAILCILLCHSVPCERIEYHFATSDPWLFVVILCRQLGSVGNAIFMVATTWFLVENDKTSLKKIKCMIADNQVISLLFLGLFWCLGYNIGVKESIRSVFPFLFIVLWYITCYVMYYSLHGFVNKALRNSDIKPKIAMVTLFIFNGIIFIFSGGLYFTELFGFILIHAFTWFLKKQLNDIDDERKVKVGYSALFVGIIGWILGAIVLNLVGVHVEFIGLKLQNWNRFFNPFVLAIAYGSMLVASCKNFYSWFINNISGLSLYIYIITGNQLLRFYFDNDLYDIISNKFGSSMLIAVIFVFSYAMIKMVVGCLLACGYKLTVAKVVSYISKKEVSFFENKIYNLLK